MTIERLLKLLAIAELLAEDYGWDVRLYASGTWEIYDGQNDVVVTGDEGSGELQDWLLSRIENDVDDLKNG